MKIIDLKIEDLGEQIAPAYYADPGLVGGQTVILNISGMEIRTWTWPLLVKKLL